jgi:serine/threonine protein kinase/ketosteroid isomerase-like protein
MRYCQSCHRCFGDGAEFCLFDQTPTFLVELLPLIIDGKYRLERLIAHGGMGSVYRATHQQLERAVAIKILRAEFLEDPVIAERFNREARAAARLKHPNIVAIYDFGFLPYGAAYLVMELIEGRSLREEMRTLAARHGQMRPERAATILAQVCAGIEAAHHRGIIHRDLKPDNVMIETATDGSERVLVLDFGIAKLKDRDQGMRGITDENTVIGTPNYISPEQCTGQTVDARSDIYSLGVILYEMLTGRTPFAGQNTSAVLLRHLQEPPAPPSRFRPGLSGELEQVVLRALAKNPSQRFAAAAQFAEHLLAAAKSSSGEVDEDAETRPRQPVIIADEITRIQPGAALNVTEFDTPDSVEPDSAEPDSVEPDSVEPDSVENDVVRPPTLLIERQPRTRFYAAVAVAVIALIGFFGYLWLSEWQAQADEPANSIENTTAGVGASEMPTARPAGEAVQISGNKSEPGVRKATPASFEKIESSSVSATERTQREVRSVYTEWAASAARGDWARHMSFYADRVNYFRDGALTRAKVEARKRRVFGGFDSYSLRFSASPQVQLRQSNGVQEADVIFDRQWRVYTGNGRGRKRVEGRAQGVITLRREARGWRIVSEKQIRR